MYRDVIIQRPFMCRNVHQLQVIYAAWRKEYFYTKPFWIIFIKRKVFKLSNHKVGKIIQKIGFLHCFKNIDTLKQIVVLLSIN